MIPDLSFYWKLLLQRLPVMMLFVLVFSGLGVITALKLPETWSTSARLLLEAPQIPGNVLSNEPDTALLDTIRQKLLTRANLIDIANTYQVFPDMAQMSPDSVFEQMQSAVTLRSVAGRGRATVMIVGFEARSGRIAANVVNEFVTLVLAENSNTRQSRLTNTLGFFRQEVERLGAELDAQSARIVQFKADNSEALPGDQRYRLDRINLLQERISQLDREKQGIDVRREEVIRIYESTGQVQRGPTQGLSQEEQQLIAARNEVVRARAVYSETHPQVVRLQNLIERLEADISTQSPVSDAETPPEEATVQSTEDTMFQSTMADLQVRTELLNAEEERIQSEIVELRDASSRSAANEIALNGLERDRANLERRYNGALNSLNTAQMSERIESAAQGQRITVIENANVPQSPTGPNRALIASAGGAFGVGLAAAYFVLLELLNRSIRRPEEMVQKFNVTPISVVPYIESRAQRFIRRTLRVTAVMAVVIGVPLALWYVDTYYVPLDLVVQRGLERLGLG